MALPDLGFRTRRCAERRYLALVGLNDLYEFELVPEADGTISAEKWTEIQHALLHLQPARTASLVGDPPRAIRVLGYGGTEVAPGLLARMSELAGTPLRVVAG